MSERFDLEKGIAELVALAGDHTPEDATDDSAGHPWLVRGSVLLAEPDPGPTPFLVDQLMVDKALIACVGRWKTTKSYGMLEVGVSVATGEPAFGNLKITEPGPVIYVCEESGRAALWRRLDSLCRG